MKCLLAKVRYIYLSRKYTTTRSMHGTLDSLEVLMQDRLCMY